MLSPGGTDHIMQSGVIINTLDCLNWLKKSLGKC